MELAACRYVVIEGPIGAGKTSLARELAQRIHADTLLEQPEDNPFLARFYDDMTRFALPTQLTFLFQRVDQLRGLTQLDMFRRPTIADFLLDKDPLFARMNLSDDEYALYAKVYSHLRPQTPTPTSSSTCRRPSTRWSGASTAAASISSRRFPPTTWRAWPTPTRASSTVTRRRRC
jgi:deoxyguanosine kinase